MVVCNWHRSKVRPSWSQGNKSVAFRLCSIERYNDKTPPHELELIFFLTFISAWLNLIHLKCMFDAYTFIIVGNTRTRAGKVTEPKNVEAETGGGQKQVTIWAEQFVNRLIQYSLPWPHMLDVIYTRMRTCVSVWEREQREWTASVSEGSVCEDAKVTLARCVWACVWVCQVNAVRQWQLLRERSCESWFRHDSPPYRLHLINMTDSDAQGRQAMCVCEWV